MATTAMTVRWGFPPPPPVPTPIASTRRCCAEVDDAWGTRCVWPAPGPVAAERSLLLLVVLVVVMAVVATVASGVVEKLDFVRATETRQRDPNLKKKT